MAVPGLSPVKCATENSQGNHIWGQELLPDVLDRKDLGFCTSP